MSLCVHVFILFRRKLKTSEIFEFSILPYTQNRKLRNLGNFTFTSNFDSSCNQSFENNKKVN